MCSDFIAGYLKSELDAEMTGEYTEDDKAYHTEGEGDGEGEIETYEGSQDEGEFGRKLRIFLKKNKTIVYFISQRANMMMIMINQNSQHKLN